MSNFIPVALSLFDKIPSTQTVLDTVLGEGFHNMTLGQVPTVAQSVGAVGADLSHLVSTVSSACGGTFSLMKSGLGLGVAAATNPYILGAGATLLIGSQLLSCSPKLMSIFDRSTAFKNTEDLTQKACQGRLQRAYGRERIIGQLNEALTDPGFAILLGGSGVGKSAVVEELACRIAEKSIPALDGARLLRLNLRSADGKLGLMGMFDDLFNGGLEKYIRNLIETLEKTNGRGQTCILFIDEIQDLLVRNPAIFDPFKEELARGSLKIIGATTDEGIVRQLTERKGTGAGMKRRVEVIKVSSMTDVEAVDVVKSHARALAQKYAPKGFKFTFNDDCYEAIIALSKESLGATLPNCATTFLTRMCVHFHNQGITNITRAQVIDYVVHRNGQNRQIIERKLEAYQGLLLKEENFQTDFFPDLLDPVTSVKQDAERLYPFFAANPDHPWMILQGPSKQLITDVASNWSARGQPVYRCDVAKLARLANTPDGKQYLERALSLLLRGGANKPILVLDNCKPQWLGPSSMMTTSSAIPDVVQSLESSRLGQVATNALRRVGIDTSEVTAAVTQTAPAAPETIPDVVKQLFAFIEQEKVSAVLVQEGALLVAPKDWAVQTLSPLTLDEMIDWLNVRFEGAGGTDNKVLVANALFALHHLVDTTQANAVLDLAEKAVVLVAHGSADSLADQLRLLLPHKTPSEISGALSLAAQESQKPVFATITTEQPCSEKLKSKVRALVGTTERAVLWVTENSRLRRESLMEQMKQELNASGKPAIYLDYPLLKQLPLALRKLVLEKHMERFNRESVLMLEEEALRDPEIVKLVESGPVKVVCFKSEKIDSPENASEGSGVLGSLLHQATQYFENLAQKSASESTSPFTKEFEYHHAPLESNEAQTLLSRGIPPASETLRKLYLLLVQENGSNLDTVHSHLREDLTSYDGKNIEGACQHFHGLYGKQLNMSLNAVRYAVDTHLTSKAYRLQRGIGTVLTTTFSILSYPVRSGVRILGVGVFGGIGYLASRVRQRIIGF
jgi:hypothetical protein